MREAMNAILGSFRLPAVAINIPKKHKISAYVCNFLYSSAMAYGAIGAILGHEMSHGFDNTGRQFDKFGEMNDWWTKSSKEKFNNRTKCMVDQYNQYEVAGGHHVSHLEIKL